MQNNNFVDKYTYRVEWSEEDQTHIARCLEFPSLAAHGNTTDRALKEIEKVVTETVNWLQEEREPVPEPFGLKQYKGTFNYETYGITENTEIQIPSISLFRVFRSKNR